MINFADYSQYLEYEYGDVVYDSENLKIFVSQNRSHINPHGASFPCIFCEDNGIRYFSISPDLFGKIENQTVLAERLAENPVKSLENLFPKNMKWLKVNRYISSCDLAIEDIYIDIHNYIDDNGIDIRIESNTIMLVNSENDIIGKAVVTRDSKEWREFSIRISKEYRNNSLGYFLAKCMLLNITESGKNLIYVCESANIPSVRIAEKLGLSLVSQEITGYLNHQQ